MLKSKEKDGTLHTPMDLAYDPAGAARMARGQLEGSIRGESDGDDHDDSGGARYEQVYCTCSKVRPLHLHPAPTNLKAAQTDCRMVLHRPRRSNRLHRLSVRSLRLLKDLFTSEDTMRHDHGAFSQDPGVPRNRSPEENTAIVALDPVSSSSAGKAQEKALFSRLSDNNMVTMRPIELTLIHTPQQKMVKCSKDMNHTTPSSKAVSNEHVDLRIYSLLTKSGVERDSTLVADGLRAFIDLIVIEETFEKEVAMCEAMLKETRRKERMTERVNELCEGLGAGGADPGEEEQADC
ncbi:hypothetical protein JVT61DRAFT_14074 [Boletus reticuloceps]|uniref:Uncharacterized protein n=1 Tax=Boletus reticuloceps TaxID=495285 RepID=A0A8I2YSL0_9AGAM|nr:hypothetical protein JVT61DRAFT_14074 [Boletus reticuloceps]